MSEKLDPRCTGPFSDARDCPVHAPRRQKAEAPSETGHTAESGETILLKAAVEHLEAEVQRLTAERDAAYAKGRAEAVQVVEDCYTYTRDVDKPGQFLIRAEVLAALRAAQERQQ